MRFCPVSERLNQFIRRLAGNSVNICLFQFLTDKSSHVCRLRFCETVFHCICWIRAGTESHEFSRNKNKTGTGNQGIMNKVFSGIWHSKRYLLSRKTDEVIRALHFLTSIVLFSQTEIVNCCRKSCVNFRHNFFGGFIMCYDISFTSKLKELSEYFPNLENSIQLDLDLESDNIIAHRYPVYPILRKHGAAVIYQPMEWGVIPFYVNDENKFIRQRATMLNARSERILDDVRSVWHKIKNRRCLIPVTGIFEHRGIVKWKHKVPYFVTLKDQNIFFLPALYSTANLPDL